MAGRWPTTPARGFLNSLMPGGTRAATSAMSAATPPWSTPAGLSSVGPSATEIPFVVVYDPGDIDERLTNPLNAKIEDLQKQITDLESQKRRTMVTASIKPRDIRVLLH